MAPLEAALKGAGEIGFTIMSLTVSLIAVLIPLLFMGDVVGRLFREFAITLAVTIVISAVVSLTLVPMMCAKLLRHTPRAEESGIDALGERDDSRRSSTATAGALQLGARPPAADLLVAIGTLVLTVLLYVFIPKGFFPVQDTGVDPGDHRGAAVGVLRRHGAAARRRSPRRSSRTPTWSSLSSLHRRRRHQHHAQQRPHADQPEAASTTARSQRQRRSSAACRRETRDVPASRSTCSRCRTCRSTTP